MRTRIDISPEVEEILNEIQKELDSTGLSMKELVDLCIQGTYKYPELDQPSTENLDPTK